ncbi:hypothetical protein J2X04_000984 [Lysobacter niabensis]|uniref:Uncharacterized protein n=1 Tax=Agrilutibacter niabensis TaxID=380628 RepID=A0ABU1VMC4_9GAMM|nr:hypothetical protein [Lysobacter niabensis]MDR7098637.1 hypothetical protein [Lysobacter niabensis]
MASHDELPRQVLPIPERNSAAPTADDAKEPDAKNHLIPPEDFVRMAMAKQ